MSAEPVAVPGTSALRAKELSVAVRSAALLGSSLVATWTVALLVRLILPRHLGPERFGIISFSESFAATCFVLLGLGVATYIQKEVAIRPAHASDFFGGVVAVRVVGALLLFGGMAAVVSALGRPPVVMRLVLLYGAAQLLLQINSGLAALLHAARDVRRVAVVNVVSKLLWAFGVLATILGKLPIEALPISVITAETARLVVLQQTARRVLGLRFRWDAGAVKVVFVTSLPFFLNDIATTMHGQLDVTILSILASDRDVGWYAAAVNLSGVALLLTPLVGWVLMPLFSRAVARSEDELFAVLRRSLDAMLTLAIPASLLLALGAGDLVGWIFGDAFRPAAWPLRILAPMFVLTYLAMILARVLVLLGRAWVVTLVSLGGLLLGAALDLVIIRPLAAALGPGGAGVGAAISLTTVEALVSVTFLVVVGVRAFDARSRARLARAATACAGVVAAHFAAAPLGHLRLLTDAVCYLALASLLGAVRLDEIREVSRLLLPRRSTP